MGILKRTKQAAKPYISHYRRAPLWVQIVTWVLILLIILPDPFDWIPGLTLADEILYASLLLHLLHKYGALPDEDKKSPMDLIREILGKDADKHGH